MARAGRRPGPTRTKEAIRSAAREQFAARGYGRTTIRSVAAAAQVNPALVHHYFGTKEALFLAALRLPVDPPALLREIIAAGPREQVADRLVHTFIRTWRAPRTGDALQALMRRAANDEPTATAMRALAEQVMLPRAAAALGVPQQRVAAAMSHLFGLLFTAAILGVAPLATASDEQLAELVLPAIRDYLRTP